MIERKGLGTAVSMLPTINSPFPMAIITMNLIKDLRFLFSLTKLMCFFIKLNTKVAINIPKDVNHMTIKIRSVD